MDNKYYLIGFILLLLFTGISFAGSTNSTINVSISNTTISGLTTHPSNSTVNVTKATALFSSFTKPFLGILNTVSFLLFLVVFAVGEYIIYRKEMENPEVGLSISPFIIYGLLSSVILLFPFILISYATITPTFLKSLTNYSLASSFTYEVSGMIVIATILSFVAFILFLKSIFDILIAYTEPEKRNEAAKNIRRIIVILAFVLFSPYLLIVLYLGFSEILIAVSNSFASSFTQLIHTQNIPLFHQYLSNYEGCISSPAFWQILDEIKCGASSGLYLLFVTSYPYALQVGIFSAIATLISSSFSGVALNQMIFTIIFGIIMVWSFAIVDYKLLQYVININTEKEQESFREVKTRILQYTAFMLSPALYVIFIILMSSLLIMLIGMIFTVSSGTFSFSPIPPLLAIVAYPTVTNPIVIIAGFIGIIFAVILLAVVALFALLKILASALFSIATYWYFSDVPHIKAFGERIFYIIIAIFLLPMLLLFAYSIFFGALPSLLFGAMPSGTIQTGTVFGYTITSTSPNFATITGPGLPSSGYTFQCNSVGSVSQFETYILNNLGGSQEAYSALIYACSNYIYGYSTSILIIEIIALALLIVGIFGLIHTGGAGLIAPITTFTSNIKAGKFGEAFAGLAADTSKTFGAVTKPFTKIAKQTYTYAKQPLAGTVEGAVLEGTVATSAAIASTVAAGPKYILNKAREEEERRRKEKAKKAANDDAVAQAGFEILKDMYNELNDEEKREFNKAIQITDKVIGANGNINEIAKHLGIVKAGLSKKLRNKIENIQNTKERDKWRHYIALKNKAHLSRELNEEERKEESAYESLEKNQELTDDEKNRALEEINNRQKIYQSLRNINYASKFKPSKDFEGLGLMEDEAFDERNNIYEKYVTIQKNYQIATATFQNANARINEIKTDNSLTKAEKDAKINDLINTNLDNLTKAINSLNNPELIPLLSNSNNLVDIVNTAENMKKLLDTRSQLDSFATNSNTKGNIAYSFDLLEDNMKKTISKYGYTSIDSFLSNVTKTPSYEIAQKIKTIELLSDDPEKEKVEKESLKIMLNNYGMKKEDAEKIINNQALKDTILPALNEILVSNTTASGKDLMNLIKDNYMKMASSAIQQIITIPKELSKELGNTMAVYINNPMNETFNQYYGGIKKIVSSTWEQIAKGGIDSLNEQLAKENNIHTQVIKALTEESSEIIVKLNDAKNPLPEQLKNEYKAKLKELESKILSEKAEIMRNNKAIDIYNKLPVVDTILRNVQEWNVAGTDDVVKQYKMQEAILSNQYSTLEKEIDENNKRIEQLNNLIKTAKTENAKVFYAMQIDELKEKLLKLNYNKSIMDLQRNGIKEFLSLGEAFKIEELNEEKQRLEKEMKFNDFSKDLAKKLMNTETFQKQTANIILLKGFENIEAQIKDSNTIDDIKNLNYDIYIPNFSNAIKEYIAQNEAQIVNKFNKQREMQEKAYAAQLKEYIETKNKYIQNEIEKQRNIEQHKDISLNLSYEKEFDRKLKIAENKLNDIIKENPNDLILKQTIQVIKSSDYSKMDEKTIKEEITKKLSEALEKQTTEKIANTLKNNIIKLVKEKEEEKLNLTKQYAEIASKEFIETFLEEAMKENIIPDEDKSLLQDKIKKASYKELKEILNNYFKAGNETSGMLLQMISKLEKELATKPVDTVVESGLVEPNDIVNTKTKLIDEVNSLLKSEKWKGLKSNIEELKKDINKASSKKDNANS